MAKPAAYPDDMPKAALDRGFMNARKYQHPSGRHLATVYELLNLPPSQDRECAIAAALALNIIARIKFRAGQSGSKNNE